MDRFHQLKVYVAVAESEGFAPAARRLGLSPPAVTRAVAQLEQTLGIKLLDRTTRYVRVTEAGRRYLDDAREILASLEAADAGASGINAAPRGSLAVTAPVLFGRKFVLPGILNYLQRYPDTQVEAVFLDRIVNLLEEGIDVGVRIGELADSSMQALRVGSVRMMVLAAPSYLEQFEPPASPEELTDHCLIASRGGGFGPSWRFHGKRGHRGLSIAPRLSVTSNDAAIDAAVAGFGICQQLSYQVADHIRSGQLKVLLEEDEVSPQPVHIVHREGKYGSARVRSFIDLLSDRLRADPAIQST